MSLENQVVILNFASAKQPIFREKKGEGNGYVQFGEDNKYPDYLLELFNESTKHGAIVGNKAKYVSGNGWLIKGNAEDPKTTQFIERVNPLESLTDVSKKCAIDSELFGGYYLQVIWNKEGTYLASIYHIPYPRIRTNKDNTNFWYKEDWSIYNRTNAKTYPAFNPTERKGSQIIYVKEYRPGIGTYALPGYFNALNYIAADAEVGKHVLGNAQTGFTPSKMISLYEGEPTQEEQRKIEKKFKDKFTGSGGQKFLLAFPKNKELKPEIDELGASDLTKEDFTAVDSLIQQNIYSGHQITSPALFGISEPGKLGLNTQLRDSYEIFKNTYVNDKQMSLEAVFNRLLYYYGGTGKIYIQPVDPIGIELKDQTLAQVAPRSWVLEKMGIDANKYPDAPAISGNSNSSDSTVVEQRKTERFNDESDLTVFAEFGENRDSFISLRERKVRFSSDEDMLYDELENAPLHIAFADQALTTLEANILNLISKDKRITDTVIATTLKVSKDIVTRVLQGLENKGLVSSSTGRGDITERKLTKPLPEAKGKAKSTTTHFMVRYTYEGPQDSKNRPFCAKMLDLNRMYSRSDIEKISQRLGYSVFERRGGWYTIPGTNEHRPYCRHYWVSHVVIKKEVTNE